MDPAKADPSDSRQESIERSDDISSKSTAAAAPATHASKTESHLASAQPHPHHLKWGDIAISGFAPSSDDEEDDPANFEHSCRMTEGARANVEERRRKLNRDRSMESLDAEARRIHGERRYLFRRPRALQYFRGRRLVRSSEERGSGRLELFFDLTFVGIIAVLAEEVIQEPTGASLVRYLITYGAAYLVWQWMREMFNAFYKDDLSQRIMVLFVMACLVVYGNNAPHVERPHSESPSRATAVGSYLLAEFGIFGPSLFYSFHIKAYRAQIRAHVLLWLCSCGIWIGSIFVDVRSAVAMAVIALAWEYGAWLFCYTVFFKKLLHLRYSSALNIEHEVERFNDFFTLVIGEFLYSIVSGGPAGLGVHIPAGRAVLAVIVAFCFQLLYMQGGGSRRITHPIRHTWWVGIAFFTLHIPIVSALTLCGDSMAELVHETHVKSAIRWIACETYAVGMLGLWCLAALEHERDEKGELWMPKWIRLTPRLLAGFIAIFLPLTDQHPVESTTVVAGGAVSHFHVRAAAASEATGETAAATGGIDITTSKLLGILACMSLVALLWESVTCLDGPNAKHESASDEHISRADDGHTPKAALSTPVWRGYPTLCEPGSGTFDRTHQRDHGIHRINTISSASSDV